MLPIGRSAGSSASNPCRDLPEGGRMKDKSKQAKEPKKEAQKTLKEKRAAKKEKAAHKHESAD